MQKKSSRNKKSVYSTPRRARVGQDIIAGLNEVLAHVRGEIALPSKQYEVPPKVEVNAIRARSGLSQAEFAERYGFSVRTLQEWECGRSQPPSAARAYLIVIDRYPDLVADAIRGAA
ncbi:MAG: helix-turn-helix domain-containing protein [Bryobacteraceae bacterium]